MFQIDWINITQDISLTLDMGLWGYWKKCYVKSVIVNSLTLNLTSMK